MGTSYRDLVAWQRAIEFIKDVYKASRHSRGSLLEVETQLIIAGELGYLSQAALQVLLQKSAEEGRMLNGLIASIRKAGVEAES